MADSTHSGNGWSRCNSAADCPVVLKFGGLYIMDLAIKDENDWLDGHPQVAVQR